MNFKTPYGDDLLHVLTSATAQTAFHCCIALGISVCLGILFAALSIPSRWNPFAFGAHVLEAIGPILPALAIISALGLKSEPTVALLLGLLTWNTTALFLREETTRLHRAGFVVAAKGMGASEMRILMRHVFPAVLPRMLPLGLALFASYAGLFGALGFLGEISDTKSCLGFIIFDAKSYYSQNPAYFWGSVLAFFSLISIPLLVIKLLQCYSNKAMPPRIP